MPAADLAHVKLRMPGANPAPMAFIEVCGALKSGVIDGQARPLPAGWSMTFRRDR